MRSPGITLIGKIILAITVFVIPVLVGFNNWFFSLHPVFRFSIVTVGILATSLLTYWAEHEREEDLKRQVAKLQSELDIDKHEFADIFLSEVLKILLETLKIPGQVRAGIYLKSPTTGNLRVVFDYGMKGMPDYDLEYRRNCGWVWEVWKTAESTFCDIESYGRKNVIKDFNFTRGQFTAVWSAGVRSALITPITGPSDADTPIGILVIDSSMPIVTSLLNTELIMDEAFDRARKIGQLLVRAKLVEDNL